MKKLTLLSVTAGSLTALLAIGMSATSLANNQGFPLVDERPTSAEQQPARYFVKYYKGKESEVRALLRHNNLEVVDALVKQQVLVVTGSQEDVDKLSTSDAVEYTEQEPTRKLLSQ
ncbi:TPA: ATPase [Vibrio parahaemolyticus]|uniref:ATPase n=1 Tax=Vibrio parahaemolyticus TaxID=670 RepID=UPI00111D3B96|nr:ATPase [Vibrio parahaemolyticus]TOG48602.1 ATPase [Vibrio parahaemolyticus]TOG79529.1 ATPase [Vibrio parahaemolyticus]HCH0794719.1 ATPase [Vibrio parahaemolyticus]